MKRAALLAIASAVCSAHAQDFAWSENAGWVNTAVACGPAAARFVPDDPLTTPHDAHLAGFLWAENLGWINLGREYRPGEPYDPGFGVNIAPGGSLSGFAWGENIGWINFGPVAGLNSALQPQLAGSRLLGYAWAENIGWINLELAVPEPGLYCLADLDQSGAVNLDDLDAFIDAYMLNEPCSDLDGNGLYNLDDLDLFIDGSNNLCSP